MRVRAGQHLRPGRELDGQLGDLAHARRCPRRPRRSARWSARRAGSRSPARPARRACARWRRCPPARRPAVKRCRLRGRAAPSAGESSEPSDDLPQRRVAAGDQPAEERRRRPKMSADTRSHPARRAVRWCRRPCRTAVRRRRIARRWHPPRRRSAAARAHRRGHRRVLIVDDAQHLQRRKLVDALGARVARLGGQLRQLLVNTAHSAPSPNPAASASHSPRHP